MPEVTDYAGDLDWAAVTRYMTGGGFPDATPQHHARYRGERREAVRRLTAQGLSITEIATVTALDERLVQRDRAAVSGRQHVRVP